MTSLNLQDISQYDSEGMLNRVLAFPAQLKDAQRIAVASKSHLSTEKPANVCLAGMGGSGIGGDIAYSCFATKLDVPFVVNRGYSLPNFVGKDSLVVISSYSGNTEETLSAYDDARKRDAKIVCISSGGMLEKKATEHGYPIFLIPAGSPPRAALGYLTIPLFYALYHCGIIANPEADIDETVELLEKLVENYHPSVETNLPKKIAAALHGRMPLIYSGVQTLSAVALRWKGQLAENSKVLAFCNVFPELNHNEIMGWGPLHEINRNCQIVYLRDREDHTQIKKRMVITKRILEEQTPSVIEVDSQGGSPLARVFSLVFLGDMVSVYLAALNKVDPSPIKHIAYLKENL
ncbi:bifunctional phosphoglucose/phosphomannose isomerase [bacterium]|nr:bifunctional phosphoglucose/phosphomannose isomerase [bacterium]